MTSFQNQLTKAIQAFLASKHLSLASRQAYGYDLKQFEELVGQDITSERLARYEHAISSLSLRARKRKVSAINQFLRFLYEQGTLAHYYQLKAQEGLPKVESGQVLLDLSHLSEPSSHPEGQLIALFIYHLGLQPKDLESLQVQDIDLTLEWIQLQNDGLRRVLPLPKIIVDHLEKWDLGKTYVFEHGGQPYSRQWFFTRLKAYLSSTGLPKMTAQELRRQHILSAKAQGRSLPELAKQLGLKSLTSLEKYFKA